MAKKKIIQPIEQGLNSLLYKVEDMTPVFTLLKDAIAEKLDQHNAPGSPETMMLDELLGFVIDVEMANSASLETIRNMIKMTTGKEAVLGGTIGRTIKSAKVLSRWPDGEKVVFRPVGIAFPCYRCYFSQFSGGLGGVTKGKWATITNPANFPNVLKPGQSYKISCSMRYLMNAIIRGKKASPYFVAAAIPFNKADELRVIELPQTAYTMMENAFKIPGSIPTSCFDAQNGADFEIVRTGQFTSTRYNVSFIKHSPLTPEELKLEHYDLSKIYDPIDNEADLKKEFGII